MEGNRRGVYNHGYHEDVRYLKQVRLLRDLTLKDLSYLMGIADSTLCRLENGQLQYTALYRNRFKDACRKLKISNTEAAAMGKNIELRELKKLK
ncbi:helix-turn-helix transcriptional regulator [Priestia megaterium]|uniref:helix-turn-helix transcriptional regulator n=1 Tax=Priestia megaterium TaxID=1404 RepID=UPI0030003E03